MSPFNAAARRQAVIDATLRLIEEDGVEAATTRRVAAEAGIGQSAIFYIFKSRRDLLAAVVQEAITTEIASFQGLLDDFRSGAATSHVTTVREVVRVGLEAYMDHVAANAARERAVLSLAMFAQRTEGMADLSRDLHESYYALVQQILGAAGESAGIEWTVPTEQLAPLITVITDGLVVGYLANPERDFTFTIEAAAQMLEQYARVVS